MAAETLNTMDILGASNIVISVALLVISVVLLVAAYAQRSPWSMLAGAMAIVLLGLAGLVSALARYEVMDWLPGHAPLWLAMLRIAALILLAGGAWTLTARWRRERRMR